MHITIEFQNKTRNVPPSHTLSPNHVFLSTLRSIDTYPLGSGRLDSSLVLGTEDGHVLLMDKSATRVQRDIAVGAPIFALHATGSLQTEHRLAIATRGGRILIAVNGEVRTNLTIQVRGPSVGTFDGIFLWSIGPSRNAVASNLALTCADA